MVFKGRTVAIIVVATMVLSSLSTAVVVADGGILDLLGYRISGKKDSFDDHVVKLEQAYQMIKSNYIHKVDDQKLIDGAIGGMVSALGDPYSTYMSPEQAQQFKADLKSSFSGIGAEVTLKNGRVTVVSPIKGSPAEKAGIRPEDQIIKVNDINLEGMDINEAVSKIRGPKGSKARLEIMRPGVQDVIKITVVRDEISIETVEAEMMEDGIGRITISQFAEETAKDFSKKLSELEKQGLKGLVIDVRGNPGGILPVVLEICEALLPENEVVLMTEDNEGNRTKYTTKEGKAKSYPITVLIDKGSASASEILAAALKEIGGYKLVGETTFGKGTVQTTEEFSDGSNIKLTMMKWLTPKGNWVDQNGGTKGIKPDVDVKYPEFVHAVPPQPNQVLKRNDNSSDVKNMQLVLDALGYNPGRTDGYFDHQTENALKAFQKAKGLPQTGQFDDKTEVHLQEAFLALYKDPKNDVQLQVAIQLLKKEMK